MFRYSRMWIFAFIFVSPALVQADNLSMDEKRLSNFSAFVLKKDAYEVKRAESAGDEKSRRHQREERYDRVRSNFKRPVETAPPGQAAYERKMAEMEKSYEKIRESFAAKQRHLAEALHQRIDKTKMIEYDIESASKESSTKE